MSQRRTTWLCDALLSPTSDHPTPPVGVTPCRPSSWVKAMPTKIQTSLSDDLAAFTARLDDLRADQNPDDLSKALRAAFKECELYDAYVTSLVGDTKRVKAILEVFDKVRSAADTIPRVGSQPDCATQALQTTTHDVAIFKQFRKLCGQNGLLPISHIIPEEYVRTTEHPVAYGGFSDVWEGIYKNKRVAIKSLRVYKGSDVRKVKKVPPVMFWSLLDIRS